MSDEGAMIRTGRTQAEIDTASHSEITKAAAKVSKAAVKEENPSLKDHLIVLDLDGTITYKNTFIPFVIGFFLRRPRFRVKLFRLPVDLLLYLTGTLSAGVFKERVCQAFLEGSPVDLVLAWSRTYAERVVSRDCRPFMLARIGEYKSRGSRLLLLSASPSIYVREVAKKLGIREVIATEMEIGTDRFCGRFIGANCKGSEKLRRLQEHLHGSIGDVFVIAFGDSMSDLPVLEWAAEGWLVQGDSLIPVNCRVDAKRRSLSYADRIRAHVSICRIEHWTKNVFVIPGAVVAYSVVHSPLSRSMLWHILLGFLSVCLIASSNYVINEVLDAPFDRLHPTKHIRPAAQGLVFFPAAYLQWLILMFAGLGLASVIGWRFFASMALLWVMGCLYNIHPFRTKDVAYLDVISESVNNPIRMLAGWYMITNLIPPISMLISYWMVGCYFMAIKRFSEYREIGNREVASAYRRSFAHYDENSLLVSIIFYASTAMLFFGAFVVRYRMELVLAFPFVALVMSIYLQIAFKSGSATQNPELLYKEPALMVSVVLCAIVMIALLFYNFPFMYKIFAPTLPTRTGSLLGIPRF